MSKATNIAGSIVMKTGLTATEWMTRRNYEDADVIGIIGIGTIPATTIEVTDTDEPIATSPVFTLQVGSPLADAVGPTTGKAVIVDGLFPWRAFRLKAAAPAGSDITFKVFKQYTYEEISR